VKKIPVGKFNANCLAILDQVQSKRVTVVIMKRGKPVAKLVPVTVAGDDIFDFYAGKGKIVGDVVAPALSRKEWGNLW
jgi:prevent-host-death family protein